MPDPIRETLADLRERGLYRRLRAVGPAADHGGAGPRVTLDGREVLCFASNNSLDLARDPRVADALRRGLQRWGWGAGASRLLAGHTEAHEALEADLADVLGAEAALVFPTGYMTNLGAVTALVGRGDTIVMDRACHASLYDAAAMSRARLARYPQGDAAAAAEALAAHPREKRGGSPHPPRREAEDPPRGMREDPPRGRMLLVTDAVFSMDGRRAPLGALARAAEARGAMLLLDEAHAIGVLGATGAGLAEEVFGSEHGAPSDSRSHPANVLRGGPPGPPRRHDSARPVRAARESLLPTLFVRVGTLSKALGGVGGFVAASREVIDLLVNRARPFIYTTALPAAACEAAREALRILRTEPERRTRLHHLSRHLRTRLRDEGFGLGPADHAAAAARETYPARWPSRAAAHERPAGSAAASEGRRAGTSVDADPARPPTPIVPVLFGEAERALAAAAALLEQGIFCPAVRPPTVPPRTSRLRISLTAAHTEEDLERLVAALVAARDRA